MKLSSLLYLTLLCITFSGCCSGPGDFRARMEQTAAAMLPKGVEQTRFAYIGDVQTAKGVFHVVDQAQIFTGMLAPHGSVHLLLFSDCARLVADYQPDIGSEMWPLWCKGSHVYLGGFCRLHFAGAVNHSIPPEPRLAKIFSGTDKAPTGNVIDFSQGPSEPFLTREKRYGSSGGLEDDPWKVPVSE